MADIKTFIKYPGGKSRMIKPILDRLPESKGFTDVFCGGGSIAIAYAQKYPNAAIYMNDLDPYTYSMWRVIVSGSDNKLEELFEMVKQTPTIELFKKNRELMVSEDLLTRAYLGIFFHKCTFSGMFNGLPIGGMGQKSQWKIGCHYNADNMIRKMLNIRKLLRGRTVVFNLDFREFDIPEDGVGYYDPPYITVGDKLYATGFTAEDHVALRNHLQNIKGKWLLSYNDHPKVRELYSDCKIEELNHTMTMTSFCDEKKCRVKTELLISKR
jgi:DNA adenine methylase